MSTLAPPCDVPPCDPIDPGRGVFAAWELVRVCRKDRGQDRRCRTMAQPLGAYRDLEAACMVAEDEAIATGGFFKTVLVTDPLGRVIGRWSATTMGVWPATLRPVLLRVVVDVAGVPRDIGPLGPGVLEGRE